MNSEYERWLFGQGPWGWRIGLRGLNPAVWLRHYRALRRPRLALNAPVLVRPFGGKRRKALGFVAFCRWQELTGWHRPAPTSTPPVAFSWDTQTGADDA